MFVKRNADKRKHLVYLRWKDRAAATHRDQTGPAKRHRAT